MVGFKKVWILIFSLFLFGACVPQSKQTECGSNEAFNSQLRKCVPIVQGPSAFINISSFSPLYTSTRYKNDTSPVTFTISVSNPYNQTFTIEWVHAYNGSDPDSIAGNVTTTSIIPSLYSTQIGSHIFTARVRNATGVIVDSHNFEVVIQETPRPNINTTSIFPPDYYPVLFPDSTGQEFRFTERNNGATGIGSYRVFWTLSRNGVNLSAYAETDTLTNTSTNGTNVIYYGSSTVPRFDPSTLGVGNYVLRTRIENIVSGEVVAEHQWNISVQQPDFGFVSSAGSPVTGQDSIAFFNVSYGAYPFANSSGTTSNFCVTASDPDGSYTNGSPSDPTDLDLVVRFYKDGSGSPIFEGRTDGSSAPVKSQVCFNEATAGEQANLVFNDGSPTVAHYRSLTARVFDEQTGREICGTGMPTCPVAYPIVWKILVKPLDTGVTGTFQSAQAGDNITYTTSGTSTRSANVVQNQAVTIRFIPSDGIPGYEGYDMTNAANSGFFKYSVVVKQGSSTFSTTVCKDFADPFPVVSGAIQSCTFTWPAFNPSTGAHLAPGAYQAYLLVEDTGSPVPGSIGVPSPGSTALTINATVTEPANPPRFNPAPGFLNSAGTATIATATEGQTVRFRVYVEEDEHDNYALSVGYCGLDSTCAAPTVIGSDARSWGDALYTENTFITYTIPEDVLGTTASGTVYFSVTLTDAPVTTAQARSTTVTMSIPVTNANPIPSYNSALVTPAVGATYDVFSGYQFTGALNAALTDASTLTAERPGTYQWWIGTTNDLTDPTGWTAIEGATSSTLRWTPGPELSGTRYIAVCYSDGYPRVTANSANPPDTDNVAAYDVDLDGTPDQLCQSLWTITPRTNSVVVDNLGSANGEVAVHHVPSEGIAYVAYASNNVIKVEKVEYQATGALGRPMAAITFDALPGGATADSIKHLSLTASNTSLYVAYLADATGIPGTAFRAHVRRINISNDVSQGGEKTATVFSNTTGSKRKFGFSYTGVTIAPNCPGVNCALAGRTVTFDGTALTPATHEITVNGVSISSENQALKTNIQICADCDATNQAISFATAINENPSLGLQGVTAIRAGAVVTIHGMENDGTEQFSTTEAIIAGGKILYNFTNNMWYWPISNADYPAGQNKIQILRGPDATVADASVIKNNVLTSLDTVSLIDNVFTTAADPDMYVAYSTLTGGTPKVSLLSRGGADPYSHVSTRTILTAGTGVNRIQIAAPIGTENPNVFVSARDTAGSFWVSRLPAAIGSHLSYKIESFGADAADTTILDKNNVSRIAVVPAKAAIAGGTTNEGRLIVVSNNGTAAYQSYIFRWSTVAGSPVFDSTTTFDQDSVETSSASKLAVSAPTTMVLGSVSGVLGSNSNSTMPVLRLRSDGEVEFNFLNTEVESIDSTTNSPTGEFRAPLVK